MTQETPDTLNTQRTYDMDNSHVDEMTIIRPNSW
jgi:hypothetical protein